MAEITGFAGPAVRPQYEHSMLTEEQRKLWQSLKPLFDPTIEGGGNALSKLGALLSNQDTFRHYQTPLNALGVTFDPTYLADDPSPAEIKMLKEIGESPIGARGKIALGPQAMTAERVDVVPHELGHKALEYLEPGMGSFMQELLIRKQMIDEDKDRNANRLFLGQIAGSNDIDLTERVAEGRYKSLEKRAREEIRKRLQKKPTQRPTQ